MQNIWSKYAVDYDKLNSLPSYKNLLGRYVKLINKYAISRNDILEVGMGTGNLTKTIADVFPDSNIVGVDNDEGMLKRASIKVLPNNVKILKTDGIEFLKRSDSKFDVIIMNNVLYTIKEKQIVFELIRSLLKDNGIFIFADPVPPKEYSYRSILFDGKFTLKKVLDLIAYIPSFIRILYYNIVIDHSYYRIDEAQYIALIDNSMFVIKHKEKAYANQANLFVLTK